MKVYFTYFKIFPHILPVWNRLREGENSLKDVFLILMCKYTSLKVKPICNLSSVKYTAFFLITGDFRTWLSTEGTKPKCKAIMKCRQPKASRWDSRSTYSGCINSPSLKASYLYQSWVLHFLYVPGIINAWYILYLAFSRQFIQ